MMVLTAAEKQKRYRAKKSNGNSNGNAPKVTVTQGGNVLTGIDAALTRNRVAEVELNVKILKSSKALLYQGGPYCTCRHCANVKANGSRHTLNHGPHKDANTLAKDELNRVALPGDVDYKGVA